LGGLTTASCLLPVSPNDDSELVANFLTDSPEGTTQPWKQAPIGAVDDEGGIPSSRLLEVNILVADTFHHRISITSVYKPFALCPPCLLFF